MKVWLPLPLSLGLVALLLLLSGVGVVAQPTAVEKASTYPEPTISVESLERRAEEITVRVRNRSCRGLASGSGVLLPGSLLTNRHVITGARNIEINTWDGRSYRLQSKAATLARSVDIAKVPMSSIGVVGEIAEQRVEPGEEVIVAGYPRGEKLQVTSGELIDYVDGQELDRLAFAGQAMLIDADIDTGNSGGPVLDRQGRVVGVIFAGLFPKKGNQGANSAIAVPIDEAERLLRIDGGRSIGTCRYQIQP